MCSSSPTTAASGWDSGSSSASSIIPSWPDSARGSSPPATRTASTNALAGLLRIRRARWCDPWRLPRFTTNGVPSDPAAAPEEDQLGDDRDRHQREPDRERVEGADSHDQPPEVHAEESGE